MHSLGLSHSDMAAPNPDGQGNAVWLCEKLMHQA